MLDLVRSKDIAKKIGARAKQCFYNAYKALDYLPAEARYIEGWILKDLLIEHAWIDLDGAIIDPTLWHSQPVTYYPGISLSEAELLALVVKHGDLPVAYRLLGTDKYPAYKAAFDQAIADFNKSIE